MHEVLTEGLPFQDVRGIDERSVNEDFREKLRSNLLLAKSLFREITKFLG